MKCDLDWQADDVDWVVVERVLKGVHPGRALHPREVAEAARRMTAQGAGENYVAKVLRINAKTVRKHLEAT